MSVLHTTLIRSNAALAGFQPLVIF